MGQKHKSSSQQSVLSRVLYSRQNLLLCHYHDRDEVPSALLSKFKPNHPFGAVPVKKTKAQAFIIQTQLRSRKSCYSEEESLDQRIFQSSKIVDGNKKKCQHVKDVERERA